MWSESGSGCACVGGGQDSVPEATCRGICLAGLGWKPSCSVGFLAHLPGSGVFICEMGVALFLAPTAPPALGQRWVGGGASPCCPCADRGSTAFGAWLRAAPGQDPGAFPLSPQHRLRAWKGLARQDWGVMRGLCQYPGAGNRERVRGWDGGRGSLFSRTALPRQNSLTVSSSTSSV